MFKNSTQLPLSIAVWLADSDYDFKGNDKTISATSFLQPLKSIILSGRVPVIEVGDGYEVEAVTELQSIVPSRLGTAIHSAIEQSWESPRLEATLRSLGYQQSLIDRIVINPEGELPPGAFPIYMERRSEKMLDGFKISGKFDFVSDGQLQDFKSTGTYSYIAQSNRDHYIKQGSIYRWLNPDIITSDIMEIQYIFTDWSAAKAKQSSDYPSHRIITQTYPLMSIEQTEAFLKEKIKAIVDNWDLDETMIPACTSEELWERPAQYKYYKDPSKRSRSTKNFDNYWEANDRLASDGSVGVIVTIHGEVIKCRYCSALGNCQQAEGYIAQGRLHV